jgi:glycosyltransferase involved in cell wall biosynthesis
VELLSNKDDGVWLVPPEDEEALAQAVKDAYKNKARLKALELYTDIKDNIKPNAIGRHLVESLYREQVIRKRS